MTISEKEILMMNSDKYFNRLLAIIESVPSRKRGFCIETLERDKNFSDVVMHLYEWHAMLERWYREGMDGDTPSMPAPGYKWSKIGQLNMRTWENYQDVTLNQAMKKWKQRDGSHASHKRHKLSPIKQITISVTGSGIVKRWKVTLFRINQGSTRTVPSLLEVDSSDS